MTGSNMIDIKSLVKRFGDFTAVDGVSFSVARGEVLGFLGPNGAGKSTTMKMVTGFLTPSSGSASVAGFDVLADPLGVKAAIGYLPEGAPAYPDMTPESFLNFVARVRGIPRGERVRRIADVVDKVQLAGVMRQSIDTLSKGYKRRVGLAQALLHDPDVLIMDEPTDGLDPNQKRQVRSLIHDMAQRKCIVLSTHILEEVESVCTRAVIIAKGRIVADGTPSQLRARSRTFNAVTLAVRTTSPNQPAQIRSDLESLAPVRRVEIDPGHAGHAGHSAEIASFVIYPKSAISPVAEVQSLAAARNWRVEGLGVDPGRLDDVFRDITTTPGANS